MISPARSYGTESKQTTYSMKKEKVVCLFYQARDDVTTAACNSLTQLAANQPASLGHIVERTTTLLPISANCAVISGYLGAGSSRRDSSPVLLVHVPGRRLLTCTTCTHTGSHHRPAVLWCLGVMGWSYYIIIHSSYTCKTELQRSPKTVNCKLWTVN